MATQPTAWAGLDLGLRKAHLCIVDDTGATAHESACESTFESVEAQLAAVPRETLRLIAVEPGCGVHLVRKLRAAGYPVAIFEARKASKFLAIRRSKTDSGDAHGLAELARLGGETFSQIHLKSVDCQLVRGQLAMRQKMVRLRLAAEGTIRSRLALYGRSMRRGSARGFLRTHVANELEKLNAEESVDLGEELLPVAEMCEALREYQRKLDKRMACEAETRPECRRLMEVSGVGPICALSFYSSIEDPTRFDRPSDVAAYLGLEPRRYQSGEVSRTRGITKSGDKLTRTHLVTAAMVFQRRAPDCALKDWHKALKERVGPKRARIALARKLAIVLLAMWKKDEPFIPYPALKPISGGKETLFLPARQSTEAAM